MKYANVRALLVFVAGGLPLVLLAGCASQPDLGPQQASYTTVTVAQADAKAELVKRDPVAYLHKVLENCQKLDQYTLKFTRFERRGLFRQMSDREDIQAWFRREPFSVKLKWISYDPKYDESVYVAGMDDDKVRFVTKEWVPTLKAPPGINKVDMMTPVKWGVTKRPVTDFGLERMMQRTLDALDGSGDEAVIRYLGQGSTLSSDRPMHLIELSYSPAKYKLPVQILYLDLETNLPAGSELRDKKGRLDSAYYYDDVNSNVQLSDADFLLTAEK